LHDDSGAAGSPISGGETLGNPRLWAISITAQMRATRERRASIPESRESPGKKIVDHDIGAGDEPQ